MQASQVSILASPINMQLKKQEEGRGEMLKLLVWHFWEGRVLDK